MKQVDEMPTSGQFIVIWTHAEELFAETKLIDEDGDILTLDTEEDQFVDKGIIQYPESAKYFIAE